MEPKEHNGKTILAFNTILFVIAGKHAKIVSMEDIGKKTLIGGQSRLPENTLKALNRIMAEYPDVTMQEVTDYITSTWDSL